MNWPTFQAVLFRLLLVLLVFRAFYEALALLVWPFGGFLLIGLNWWRRLLT